MGRRRNRLGWRYDAEREEFHTPSGIITLIELATIRHGLANGHADLGGTWAGWRLRRGVLVGPGSRVRIKPETLELFDRWVRGTRPESRQLELF